MSTPDSFRGATPGDAPSATVQELPEEEPRFVHEPEERKVDEYDQPSPRQLSHEGITLVPEQTQFLPAIFSERGDTNHDPYAFTNDIDYEVLAPDYAFPTPLDDMESADDWLLDFKLPG